MPKQKKLNSKWNVQTIRDKREEISLRYALYRNSDTPMRRCVVFLNGRAEWIEKNCELADDLNLPEDCGFLTWDHRGQGASGGDRSYIDSYDSYVDDAATILNEAIGDTRYIMFAHSMGSLVLLYGTLKSVFKPERVVLNAPLLALPNKPIPVPIAVSLAQFGSAIGLGKFSTGVGNVLNHDFADNRLTHDIDMFNVIKNSPYLIGSATLGWVKATQEALNYVFEPTNIESLSAPALILAASEEKIVDPEGAFRWIKIAADKARVETQLNVIHGAKHEILSEIPDYRNQGLGKIKNWFADFMD